MTTNDDKSKSITNALQQALNNDPKAINRLLQFFKPHFLQNPDFAQALLKFVQTDQQKAAESSMNNADKQESPSDDPDYNPPGLS